MRINGISIYEDALQVCMHKWIKLERDKAIYCHFASSVMLHATPQRLMLRLLINESVWLVQFGRFGFQGLKRWLSMT